VLPITPWVRHTLIHFISGRKDKA